MSIFSNGYTALPALLASFVLAGAAYAEDGAFKFDPEKLTLKESKKIYKDEGDVDDAFEEKKKVLIAGYRLGFMLNAAANVMEQGESTQVSNFSGADRVTYFSQNPDRHLTAIAKFKHDDALLQEITEEGYADLQARLKAVGREIVQMDALKESEGYKQLDIAQPDAGGQYASEDDNGGLADVNYIAKKPGSVPMWFGMANPLDKGGALAKAGTALSQKNIGAFKQLAIDADAVILDMSFRVRPAWVQGIRPKMFRSASVKVDPYLVVLPELILVQTYKKTWVGNMPSYMGALRSKLPDFMDTEEAQKFPFYYGYDYGEFKVGESVVDRSFFVPAYEKTTIVDINPDRAKFKAAVLNALKTTNATIAQWAKENPAE